MHIFHYNMLHFFMSPALFQHEPGYNTCYFPATFNYGISQATHKANGASTIKNTDMVLSEDLAQ